MSDEDETLAGHPAWDGQEPPEGAGVRVAINWPALLKCTAKGVPLCNLDNVVQVIQRDPELREHIWYDEFLGSIITDWQGPERNWEDQDDIKLQLYMQRHIGLDRITGQTCHDAALIAAFHDVRDECATYLKTRKWDKVKRLIHVMADAFGAEDNAYSAAVGRCWFISMVARVLKPGCKVDTVPVFEGKQGRGKSTALSIIGGKWFIECHQDVLNKDFYGVLEFLMEGREKDHVFMIFVTRWPCTV